MIIDSSSSTLDHRHILHTRKSSQPAVMFLMHTVGYNTFVAISRLLCLQATTVGTHAALSVIHSLLKRVILPAEDVVSMLSISSVVSSRKDERLRAIGGPLNFVVEFAGVPDDLQRSQLWCNSEKVLELTSSMTCGIFTGCVEGHAPPVPVPEKRAGPLLGYAT